MTDFPDAFADVAKEETLPRRVGGKHLTECRARILPAPSCALDRLCETSRSSALAPA